MPLITRLARCCVMFTSVDAPPPPLASSHGYPNTGSVANIKMLTHNVPHAVRMHAVINRNLTADIRYRNPHGASVRVASLSSQSPEPSNQDNKRSARIALRQAVLGAVAATNRGGIDAIDGRTRVLEAVAQLEATSEMPLQDPKQVCTSCRNGFHMDERFISTKTRMRTTRWHDSMISWGKFGYSWMPSCDQTLPQIPKHNLLLYIAMHMVCASAASKAVLI